MDTTYVFAGLVVTNRDEAAAWYERLLGRPPTFLPNDAEAVWQLASTASVYLLADPDRAGRGITALVVDDLDATLAEIAERGIVAGAKEQRQTSCSQVLSTNPRNVEQPGAPAAVWQQGHGDTSTRVLVRIRLTPNRWL